MELFTVREIVLYSLLAISFSNGQGGAGINNIDPTPGLVFDKLQPTTRVGINNVLPSTTGFPANTVAPTSGGGPKLGDATEYQDLIILGGTPIPTAASLDDCLAICFYSRSCHGFEWNYLRNECFIHTYLTECDPFQNKRGTNHYRLKADCDPVLPTCYNVVFQDFSSTTRDGGVVILTGQSFDNCKTLCRIREECQGVTYRLANQECSMHTTSGLPRDDTCCLHSRKLCDDPTTPVGPTTRPTRPGQLPSSTAPPAVSTTAPAIPDNGKCPAQLQVFTDTRAFDGTLVEGVNDTEACKAWCLANATCAAVVFDLTTNECFWQSNDTYDPALTETDTCCVMYRRLTEFPSHAEYGTLHDCVLINYTTSGTPDGTTTSSNVGASTPDSASQVSPDLPVDGATTTTTQLDPGILTNEVDPPDDFLEPRTAEDDDFETPSKTDEFEEEEEDDAFPQSGSLQIIRSGFQHTGTTGPFLGQFVQLDFISGNSEIPDGSENILIDIDTKIEPHDTSRTTTRGDFSTLTTTPSHDLGQRKRCWTMEQIEVTDDFGGEYVPIEELVSVSSNTTDQYADIILEECDGLCAVEAAFTLDSRSGALSSSGPGEAARYCDTSVEKADLVALGRSCRVDVLSEDDHVKNVSMLCYCQTDACNAFWVQLLQATIAHYPLDCNTLDLSFAGRHGDDFSMGFSGVDQAKNWSGVFNGSNHIEVKAFMNLLLGQIGPSPYYFIAPNFTVFFWFKFTYVTDDVMTMISNGPHGRASIDVVSEWRNGTHRSISATAKIRNQLYTATVLAPYDEWRYFAARIVPNDISETLELVVSTGVVTGETDYDVTDIGLPISETGIRLDPTGNILSIGRQQSPLPVLGGNGNTIESQYYVGFMDEIWFLARSLSDFEVSALVESSYYPHRLDTS